MVGKIFTINLKWHFFSLLLLFFLRVRVFVFVLRVLRVQKKILCWTTTTIKRLSEIEWVCSFGLFSKNEKKKKKADYIIKLQKLNFFTTTYTFLCVRFENKHSCFNFFQTNERTNACKFVCVLHAFFYFKSSSRSPSSSSSSSSYFLLNPLVNR